MDTSIDNISAHPSVRLSPNEFRMTTILVGPDKTRFDVHQDLLTFHSDFFKAALTGRFREAFEKIVTIPSVDPVTFEFFVYWLNKGSFPEESDAPARMLNDWVADDDDAIKTENLIRLYVFGEMYGIKELKLSALRELFWFMVEPQTELPNGKQVRYAHDNLPASSPLLAYLVDLFCAYAGEEVWEDDCDVRFPAVFVTAVLRRYAEYARGDRGHHDDLDLCDYHNHQDDSEGERCPDRAGSVI